MVLCPRFANHNNEAYGGSLGPAYFHTSAIPPVSLGTSCELGFLPDEPAKIEISELASFKTLPVDCCFSRSKLDGPDFADTATSNSDCHSVADESAAETTVPGSNLSSAEEDVGSPVGSVGSPDGAAMGRELLALLNPEALPELPPGLCVTEPPEMPLELPPGLCATEPTEPPLEAPPGLEGCESFFEQPMLYELALMQAHSWVADAADGGDQPGIAQHMSEAVPQTAAEQCPEISDPRLPESFGAESDQLGEEAIVQRMSQAVRQTAAEQCSEISEPPPPESCDTECDLVPEEHITAGKADEANPSLILEEGANVKQLVEPALLRQRILPIGKDAASVRGLKSGPKTRSNLRRRRAKDSTPPREMRGHAEDQQVQTFEPAQHDENTAKLWPVLLMIAAGSLLFTLLACIITSSVYALYQTDAPTYPVTLGADPSWAAMAPSTVPSYMRDQRVSSVVANTDIESARAHATADYIKTAVRALRRKLRTRRRR